uniref:Cupin 2 conserved barrel domain-containing protein n=1 Tax=Zooxanthella nutricula TaxID=1333877 RepID=A0A7S2IJL9_9DINO
MTLRVAGVRWVLLGVACLSDAAARLPDYAHYRGSSPDEREALSGGGEVARWHAPCGPLEGRPRPGELTERPPTVTRLTLPAGGRFPPEGEAMWLGEDAAYFVMSGAVACEACQGRRTLATGDVFVSNARRPHGPFVAKHGAVVVAVTTSRFDYHTSSPPAPKIMWHMGQRAMQSPHWDPSGMFGLSDLCKRSGGVHQHNWPQMGRLPNVMAVSLNNDCFIPCHQHIGGALYVVVEGAFIVHGDGGWHNTTFHAGDLRWARGGFAYGPEYGGPAPRSRLNVIGMPGAVEPGRCHAHPVR